MKTSLAITALLGLVLGTAWALDPPEPPAVPPAADEPPATAPPASETPGPAAEDDGQDPAPPPAGTTPSAPTPQRFDPSEEVRADFPVSFPIDI